LADGETRKGATPRAAIRIPKTAEVVADAIRRQITGGELKEGDTLPPEAMIIEEFSVSRPTLREAFRILESEKLISVSRGARGGARVHVPKADQVARYAGFVLQTRKVSYRDVYEARIVIEPPAARLVAERHSKDATTILRGVIEAAREANVQGDFGRAVAAFHSRLIELTGNETLILISGMLDGIVAEYQSRTARMTRSGGKTASDAEAGLKSQEKLVALIEAGDGPGAEAHWRAHMENSARVWLAQGGRADSVVDWGDM